MAWSRAYWAATGPGPPASPMLRASNTSGGGAAAAGSADGCSTTPAWWPCGAAGSEVWEEGQLSY